MKIRIEFEIKLPPRLVLLLRFWRMRRYKRWLQNERLALAHYSTGF